MGGIVSPSPNLYVDFQTSRTSRMLILFGISVPAGILVKMRLCRDEGTGPNRVFIKTRGESNTQIDMQENAIEDEGED